MKRKVLLVSDFHANVYGWRKEIIEELTREGNQIALAVPYGGQLDYFKNIGCLLFDVKLNRKSTGIFSNLSLLKQYRNILVKYKPDIVLLYGSKGMLYTGYYCQKMGIPYFSNINGLGTVETMKFPIKQILLFLYKLVLPNSTCIFFQNEYNMKKLVEMKITNNHYRLIPGSGVNTKKFNVLPYPENDETRFLFCGRIMKEKGIGEYIEAARKLKNKGYKVKFDVVGMYDDDFGEKVIQNNLDIIEYFGFQNDVMPFLKKANCVVLPSYYGEGISNSLLESASSGRAIITTDMPGCRETVINEKTGYIVDPKDSDELSVAMEKFVNLPKSKQKEMGMDGREHIIGNFSRDVVVDAYLEEYKKLFDED